MIPAMWLIDTSVVARWHDRSSALYSPSVQAVDILHTRHEVLCICTQVAVEYFVVATRPQDANGLGKSVADALQDLQDLRALFLWLPEPTRIDLIWEQLITKYQVSGKRAHDMRLVALAVAHGVRNILTWNIAHFQMCTEVSPVLPTAIVSQNP